MNYLTTPNNCSCHPQQQLQSSVCDNYQQVFVITEELWPTPLWRFVII